MPNKCALHATEDVAEHKWLRNVRIKKGLCLRKDFAKHAIMENIIDRIKKLTGSNNKIAFRY